jgi:hypothetical protein
VDATWKKGGQKVVMLNPVIEGIDKSVEGRPASRPFKKGWVLSHIAMYP